MRYCSCKCLVKRISGYEFYRESATGKLLGQVGALVQIGAVITLLGGSCCGGISLSLNGG
jgi:hypothetical protein